MTTSFADLSVWAPLAGRWKLEPNMAHYLGPEDGGGAAGPFGLVVSPARLRSGTIRATITFEGTVSVGRTVFGYNAATGAYFAAGVGGYHFAYTLDEFLPHRGWKAVQGKGSDGNLRVDRPYRVELQVKGQSVRLLVDTVRVLEDTLPSPLTDDQIGLTAFGSAPVRFKDVELVSSKPKAFVVMQFGEPYDSLYQEVIKPVAESMGLDAYRADDVYRPGIVLQDIVRGIVESEVVIAEITPANPNVFYELGFAHARDKQTILLAERGRDLPFDVRSYRCIFYDNTIRGKSTIEAQLREHLVNILDGHQPPTAHQ